MASRRAWFESVAKAQRRAKKRLPKSVYMAFVAGSELGVTLRDNVLAFRELGSARTWARARRSASRRPRCSGRTSHFR
jgi:hypothetical protein